MKPINLLMDSKLLIVVQINTQRIILVIRICHKVYTILQMF